ncbi:DUF2188 domain-containing protein [Oceanobacillus polygoni]|uniref:DUF2188 domain-containing protein n=1 Tax=Oceanobacillus polygoni TaxID=1235259 RepID=UPI0011F2A6B3|nr:DUF2188 domain-containing protein [Oceanobacillus polygoni]
MPWTLDDYPSSMKNLNEVTRKKAIDIANSMVDDGYSDDRAIPIAITQAKEWRENAEKEEIDDYKMHGKPTMRSKEGKKYSSNPERLEEGEQVIAHENGWAVKSSGAERANEVFDKKDEAVKRAKEIAKNKGTTLTIYKQDGTVQDKQTFHE